MPNLGNSNISGYTAQSAASNYIVGQKFTMTEAGTMTDFWWYGYGGGVQCRVHFAVYANGSPHSLVWDSGELTPDSVDNATPTWTHVTGLSVALSAGDYWFVWNSNETDPHYYSTGSGSEPHYTSFTYAAMPSTVALADNLSYANLGIYITYSTGGSGVTPEADNIVGTGSQPTPTIQGAALMAPNHIAQATEVVDPTLATTQNLGVGNYRSTTVLMNW